MSYTYDALGRVLSETSRGITHTYSYDLTGNRVRADYGTGRSVQTSFDALNRPESIVEGERATRYGYALGGRAVILMAGNGQVTSNSYDALGRLKERTLFRTQSMGEADVLARFSWEHDLLGNVTTQSETWPGEPTRPGTRSTSMAYDANNRLIHETVNDTTAGVTTTAYAYDAANNRSTKQVTGGTEPGVWSYNYNTANQLTSWQKQLNGSPAKTAALTYDAAGNRTGQSVTTLNSQPATLNTTYAWDAQDRLASVTLPATVVAGVSTPATTHSYEYDYRTRRIGTVEATSSSLSPSAAKHTAIVFAGGLSLAEYDVSASPSSSIEHRAVCQRPRHGRRRGWPALQFAPRIFLFLLLLLFLPRSEIQPLQWARRHRGASRSRRKPHLDRQLRSLRQAHQGNRAEPRQAACELEG